MLAERTFWERATTMHVYCLQGPVLGKRWSRRWHDLVRLDHAGIATRALSDRELALVGRPPPRGDTSCLCSVRSLREGMDVAANPTYIFNDAHGVGYRIAGPEGGQRTASLDVGIPPLYH